MHVPFLPLRQKHTLDLHYVARLCLLDIGAREDQFKVSGDISLPELIGRLLYLDFLHGDKIGMLWYEAQLAGNAILLALARLALGEQLEVLVEDLHVVLTSADIAGECGDGEAGLDLVRPDDDALQHDQTADEGGVELTDGADAVGLGGAVDDAHLELAVHAGWDHLVFGEVPRIVSH
jgi:hypothetical protein